MSRTLHGPRGFSLVEIIVVISLMGILAAFALPSFLTWRENMNYRQVARAISGDLSTTRSRAISTNRQHQLEFNASERTYKLLIGNRSYGSNSWTSAGLTSLKFPLGVSLRLSPMQFDYFPNGTSSGGIIDVTDDNNVRYRIRVEQTGRIRTEKLK